LWGRWVRGREKRLKKLVFGQKRGDARKGGWRTAGGEKTTWAGSVVVNLQNDRGRKLHQGKENCKEWLEVDKIIGGRSCQTEAELMFGGNRGNAPNHNRKTLKNKVGGEFKQKKGESLGPGNEFSKVSHNWR